MAGSSMAECRAGVAVLHQRFAARQDIVADCGIAGAGNGGRSERNARPSSSDRRRAENRAGNSSADICAARRGTRSAGCRDSRPACPQGSGNRRRWCPRLRRHGRRRRPTRARPWYRALARRSAREQKRVAAPAPRSIQGIVAVDQSPRVPHLRRRWNFCILAVRRQRNAIAAVRHPCMGELN